MTWRLRLDWGIAFKLSNERRVKLAHRLQSLAFLSLAKLHPQSHSLSLHSIPPRCNLAKSDLSRFEAVVERNFKLHVARAADYLDCGCEYLGNDELVE